MKRGLLLLNLLNLFFLIFIVSSGLASQKQSVKTEKKINIFCSKIALSNFNCQLLLEIKQKKLEIKENLYQAIKEYCARNPQERECKKKLVNPFNYCNKLSPQDLNCEIWRELKRKELEIKGLLFEEITHFCQQNPSYSFCK